MSTLAGDIEHISNFLLWRNTKL